MLVLGSVYKKEKHAPKLFVRRFAASMEKTLFFQFFLGHLKSRAKLSRRLVHFHRGIWVLSISQSIISE